MTNLVTDVPGIPVGSAHEARAATALPYKNSLPGLRQRVGGR
jgi:hypothetical protein